MSFNVQGSVTVRRLRTGATITLYATTSGALQQFVNIDSGDVTPDWTIDANQPIITPAATASSGVVYISNGTWSYNGVTLVFDGSQGTTTEGWTIDTSGKFAMDEQTFALRIIANLASEINYASDTLEFTCVCTYEGHEYTMTWTTDITILQAGTTGYQGYLYADTKVLTAEVAQTAVRAQLLDGMTNVSGFYTKWYYNYVGGKVFAEVAAEGTTATVTVTRDDVNGGDNNDGAGGTLFVCEFYKSQTDSDPIATAAISIADEADEYSLVLTLGDNKELAENQPVTVTASIYSLSQQRDITKDVTVNEWELAILGEDLQPVYKVDTNEIEVTTAYSVDDGDVNVVGSCDFTL